VMLSRSLGVGRRYAYGKAEPGIKLAKEHAWRGVGIAIRGTGGGVRKAAVVSGRYVYERAGAGIDALGRSWRQMRR
jgi:hypothetical protein